MPPTLVGQRIHDSGEIVDSLPGHPETTPSPSSCPCFFRVERGASPNPRTLTAKPIQLPPILGSGCQATPHGASGLESNGVRAARRRRATARVTYLHSTELQMRTPPRSGLVSGPKSTRIRLCWPAGPTAGRPSRRLLACHRPPSELARERSRFWRASPFIRTVSAPTRFRHRFSSLSVSPTRTRPFVAKWRSIPESA